jgi:hypothetical protein
MLQMIWLFLLLFSTPSIAQNNKEGTEDYFTNQAVRYNPGVFFEKVGTVQLSNENWKLLTYIDIEMYNNRLEYSKLRFNQLKRFCAHEYSEYCQKVIISMQRTMNNIKSSVKQLHMQLGTKETGRTRVRRGMFDSVGETAKILFGVMDHDDANYYFDKIK